MQSLFTSCVASSQRTMCYRWVERLQTEPYTDSPSDRTCGCPLIHGFLECQGESKHLHSSQSLTVLISSECCGENARRLAFLEPSMEVVCPSQASSSYTLQRLTTTGRATGCLRAEMWVIIRTVERIHSRRSSHHVLQTQWTLGGCVPSRLCIR